jgi:hypothetical protein
VTGVYENESFIVVPNTVDNKYEVHNRTTLVKEFEDQQIANAISYAEHAHSFLKYKLWRAVAIQSEANAAYLDKNGDKAALDAAIP